MEYLHIWLQADEFVSIANNDGYMLEQEHTANWVIIYILTKVSLNDNLSHVEHHAISLL